MLYKIRLSSILNKLLSNILCLSINKEKCECLLVFRCNKLLDRVHQITKIQFITS